MKKNRKKGTVTKPESETIANAAVGAVVGGMIAGPVGVLVGAATGVMVEKGPTRRKARGRSSGGRKTASGKPAKNSRDRN